MTSQEPRTGRRDDTLAPRDVAPAATSIVAVVCSGALDDVERMLAALPPVAGTACIVARCDERAPRRDRLPRAGSWTVVACEHGAGVEAGRVYVGAPGTSVAVEAGRFVVEQRGEEGAGDRLFTSVARAFGAQCAAVVLGGSATGLDRGICEVKAAGGLVLAQDPETAEQRAQIDAALATGCVDAVLAPASLASRLVAPAQPPGTATSAPAQVEIDPFARILELVHAASGVDFGLYRDTTIRRRILRRMALRGERSPDAYARDLDGDRAELNALYDDLLIHVTSFFRDSAVFESLARRVLPVLFSQKPAGEKLRVWVPGCSSGQEAYSLLMLVLEYAETQSRQVDVQLFATDLADVSALEKARAGLYPVSIARELSPERLSRFFRREERGYRIEQRLRDMCVFARQNLIADPPFSHLDLISCRNVLIYLDSALQKRVIPTFHYALRNPGFLVLGSAETIGDHGHLFQAVDRENRIFVKRPGAGRATLFVGNRRQPALLAPPAAPTAHAMQNADFLREADRILLGRYAPPGVLVDERYEIQQFRGRTADYLEPPTGEPTSNLFKMAREGLFLELRTALGEARATRQPVRTPARVVRDGSMHRIELEVIPVQAPRHPGTSFLVLFHELGADRVEAAPPRAAPGAPVGPESESETVERLRRELAASIEYAHALSQQQDAANEELRSANEEIISSNEELQSTNEELETAKEELQSTNEELTTVNEQLQQRNLELTHINNDLSNLLASIDMPVVMVGRDLSIRRFTMQARKVLHLVPSDVGRPISDIQPAVDIVAVQDHIREVMRSGQAVEHEVRDRDDRWYTLRIHPYRTPDGSIDGAALVLVDIDQMRRAREALREQTGQLRRQALLMELSPDAVVVRDREDRVTSWNAGAVQLFGRNSEDALGRPFHELVGTRPAEAVAIRDCLERDHRWEGELHHRRADGQYRTLHARELLFRDAGGDVVMSILRDITDHRRMVDELREADRRKNQFLAMLAHELRNPIAPIRNAAELLRSGMSSGAIAVEVGEILERQSLQLSRIVEDLIDVSRIVEKKVELRIERVPVQGIVRTVLETCSAQLRTSDRSIRVSMPEQEVLMDVDPQRFAQVLVNLMSNALKFTDRDGTIELTATVDERPDGPPHLVLAVSDDGIGIRPSLLPRIFDPFVQGDDDLERRRGGLGVGLALVRSVVQMHGGRVEAHSDGAGRGSRFVVYMPLAQGDPPPASSARQRPGRSAAPRRVLVVDDNVDQATSLEMLLTTWNHEVRLAHDGHAALAAADAFDPDVALIDIGLPGLSGYEVARRLRADPRHRAMLLVAQTGWGQSWDREASREAGFDHHLVKPLDPQTLEQLIDGAPARGR